VTLRIIREKAREMRQYRDRKTLSLQVVRSLVWA
jgi:hypothetical protein